MYMMALWEALEVANTVSLCTMRNCDLDLVILQYK